MIAPFVRTFVKCPVDRFQQATAPDTDTVARAIASKVCSARLAALPDHFLFVFKRFYVFTRYFIQTFAISVWACEILVCIIF